MPSAHPTRTAAALTEAPDVRELQADRIAERLVDLGDPTRLPALDVGVDDLGVSEGSIVTAKVTLGNTAPNAVTVICFLRVGDDYDESRTRLEGTPEPRNANIMTLPFLLATMAKADATLSFGGGSVAVRSLRGPGGVVGPDGAGERPA